MALVADGLQTFARRVAVARDTIRPVIDRDRLVDLRRDVRALATALLQETASPGYAPPALADAVAGMRELAGTLGDANWIGRRTLARLHAPLEATATQLVDELPPVDPSYRVVATELRQVLSAGADTDTTAASRALELLPPAVIGDQATSILGLPTPNHVVELRHILTRIIRGVATDAERERLGLMHLAIVGDDAAADRIRALALDVFERDPQTLSRPAWHRLANLLELDAGRGALLGPRDFGTESWGLEALARRRAAGTPRRGAATSMRGEPRSPRSRQSTARRYAPQAST